MPIKIIKKSIKSNFFSSIFGGYCFYNSWPIYIDIINEQQIQIRQLRIGRNSPIIPQQKQRERIPHQMEELPLPNLVIINQLHIASISDQLLRTLQRHLHPIPRNLPNPPQPLSLHPIPEQQANNLPIQHPSPILLITTPPPKNLNPKLTLNIILPTSK